MPYVIVDKKRFVTFLISVFLIIVSCVFLAFYFLNKKDVSADIDSGQENKIEEPLEKNKETMELVSENNQPIASSSETKKEDAEILVEYENQKFSYAVKFTENWHMNNDSSESDFMEVEIDEDIKIKAGGQTFWSNYSNINDYSPENKPDDFRLLNLTIYQKENVGIDELAKILGFDDEFEKIDFEARNMKGYQYVAPGIIAGNPRVAVIFQKNSSFYVFRMAFIGGDMKVAEEMEKIISSFSVK